MMTGQSCSAALHLAAAACPGGGGIAEPGAELGRLHQPAKAFDWRKSFVSIRAGPPAG
jgi:hypothetical protein